jgi:hypothetical protein
MKTDLKVELFLIHQTYFTDNHADRAKKAGFGRNQKDRKTGPQTAGKG